MSRRRLANDPIRLGALVVVVAAAAGGLARLEGHFEQQSFEENVAQVERFCGPKRAAVFRTVHDPHDQEKPVMQEWVRRCQTGER